MTAATSTLTEELDKNSNIYKLKWVWTSDSSAGTATGTTGFQTTVPITGTCHRLVTIPTSSAAPDDNYDVYILDEDSADILVAGGLKRSTSAAQGVVGTSLGCVKGDKITLSITGAGNSKEGTVILYLIRGD